MRLVSLPTPSFVIDRYRLEENCRAMRVKAAGAAVSFRPHVKTHKTLEIGRLQHGGARGPITVSTLAEADFFASGGFSDITYAVPIAPEKLLRAVEIASRIDHFYLLVDSLEVVEAMEAVAYGGGVTFEVLLKIDCGYHRAGVDPDSAESVVLARRIASSPAIRFQGLLTHAGHSYHARSRDEILAIARAECDSLTRFRGRLGDSTLLRSVGSTPTLAVPDTLGDCDEVRPGNYVFFDAFQATLGSCRFEDIAASILTTVIGSYADRAVIDAGALALSKDLGAGDIDPDAGYGTICDLDCVPLDLRLTEVSQEHGKIVGPDVARVEVGSLLRIVPNHSCLSAALFDRFFVMDGDEVIDEWRPARGW